MKTIIHIPLNQLEIIQCLEKALQHKFIDNLRHRHPNIQLDNKLRGYIGEFAFKKWMQEEGIKLNFSNIRKDSNGMDIDFLYRKAKKKIHIELKTSLIPDIDQSIEQVIERRDIKLIRRQQQPIEELSSDVHVQIIFKQLRLRKDDWLKKQNIDLKKGVERIYEEMAAYRYKTDTFVVGWIDKPSLIELLNSKPKHLRLWKYGMREFWTCNLLNEAKHPKDLKDYLNAIE